MDFTRVSYKGLIADIKPNDLEDALRILREMSPKEKVVYMASVNRALDDVLALVAKKRPLTSQILQDACNDIGIWFANEMIEGRSEQYRVMVS